MRIFSVLLTLVVAICSGCGSGSESPVLVFPTLGVGSYTGLLEEVSGSGKVFLYLRVSGEERAVWVLSGGAVEYGVATIGGPRALKLSYGLSDIELFGVATSSDTWKGETADGHYHWRLQRARPVRIPEVSGALRTALAELSSLGVDLNVAPQRELINADNGEPSPGEPSGVTDKGGEDREEPSVCRVAPGELAGVIPSLRKQRDALLAKRTRLSDAYAKHGPLSGRGRLGALGRLYLQREGELRQMRATETLVNSSSFREERAAALQAEIESERERIRELGGILE